MTIGSQSRPNSSPLERRENQRNNRWISDENGVQFSTYFLSIDVEVIPMEDSVVYCTLGLCLLWLLAQLFYGRSGPQDDDSWGHLYEGPNPNVIDEELSAAGITANRSR
jgi:hypothetical protein